MAQNNHDHDEQMENTENQPEDEHIAVGTGRDAVEDSLRQQVVVEHFPLTTAGSPVQNIQPSENEDIEDSTRIHDNPYAPFASQIDWEVAQWAKLHGPGSGAVSELLGIAGVSVFSLHLIDKF
jgi:hypothetical protein